MIWRCQDKAVRAQKGQRTEQRDSLTYMLFRWQEGDGTAKEYKSDALTSWEVTFAPSCSMEYAAAPELSA